MSKINIATKIDYCKKGIAEICYQCSYKREELNKTMKCCIFDKELKYISCLNDYERLNECRESEKEFTTKLKDKHKNKFLLNILKDMVENENIDSENIKDILKQNLSLYYDRFGKE